MSQPPANASRVAGRYASKLSDLDLLDGVKTIYGWLGLAPGQQMSQRVFDRSRQPAGQSELPTAKQIAHRLRMPWADVVRVAASNDPSRSLGRRQQLQAERKGERIKTVSAEDTITMIDVRLSLRAVVLVLSQDALAFRQDSDRGGVVSRARVGESDERAEGPQRIEPQSLAMADYRVVRERLLAEDRCHHQPARALLTIDQILAVTSDWASALELVGLQSPGQPDREAVELAVLIDVMIERFGVLPLKNDCFAYARRQNVSLKADRRPWAEVLDDVRELRARRGQRMVERAPAGQRPDYARAPIIENDGLPRRKRHSHAWTDEELIAALVRFLQDPAVNKHTTRAYGQWTRTRTGEPGISILIRAGFSRLLAKARQRARAVQ